MILLGILLILFTYLFIGYLAIQLIMVISIIFNHIYNKKWPTKVEFYDEFDEAMSEARDSGGAMAMVFLWPIVAPLFIMFLLIAFLAESSWLDWIPPVFYAVVHFPKYVIGLILK